MDMDINEGNINNTHYAIFTDITWSTYLPAVLSLEMSVNHFKLCQYFFCDSNQNLINVMQFIVIY